MMMVVVEMGGSDQGKQCARAREKEEKKGT